MSDSKNDPKTPKQPTGESEEWDKVRHTATRTEVRTSADAMEQELLLQAESIDPSLIVIQGDLIGRVFRIKEGRNVIGRHATCQIPVHQRAVSSFHAEIRRNQDSVVLEDLQSTNGTIHNKTQIKSPVVLKAGDLIKVGNSVFKFVEKQLDAAFSESMHQQMTRDALTGIFNRAYVKRALSSSMEIAKTGYPLSVVMIDLDHFKKINDSHGHLAGDYVLVESCRALTDTVVRGEDIFGRYGGEEFIVVMPDCALEAAAGVAERIRRTLESHAFEFNGVKIPVTASLGVAVWSPKYSTQEEFIGAADALLYKSKQEGRNRVSVLKE